MPLEPVRAFGRWLALVTIGIILLTAGGAALRALFVPPDVQMPSRVVSDNGVDADLDGDFLTADSGDRRHFVVGQFAPD